MSKSLIDCNQPRNVKAHPTEIMKTRLPKRRRGERRPDGRAEASVAARSRGRACDRSSLILGGVLTPPVSPHISGLDSVGRMAGVVVVERRETIPFSSLFRQFNASTLIPITVT